jgi:hypothetical protein
MISRILSLLCFAATTACGQTPVQFAKSDRIVTIESWSRQEAKVWAVQTTQIVIYRQSDFAKDQLVMTKPISISQAQAIREAMEAIPRDAFGFHYAGGYSTHPPLLRLRFTRDDTWTARRIIEASGQMPNFAEPILDAISSACPPEWRVDFGDVAATYLQGLDGQAPPEIRKIGIREYYGQKSWWEFWK